MKRKFITRIIGLLVLAGLIIWAWSRWDAWFGNPTEAPYDSSPIPSRILLTFGDSIGENRNVSWQCDSVLLPSHLNYKIWKEQLFKPFLLREKSMSRKAIIQSYMQRMVNDELTIKTIE